MRLGLLCDSIVVDISVGEMPAGSLFTVFVTENRHDYAYGL
jgi:hypothetical protein